MMKPLRQLRMYGTAGTGTGCSKARAARAAALLLAVLGTGMTLAGCPGSGMGSAATRSQDRPLHFYAGTDASLSARADLGSYAALIAQMSENLRPRADQMTLYRMDHDTEEIADGPANGSAEATLTTLAREVRPTSQKRATRPDRFWTTVAARTETDAGGAVVLLASDGDNDDASAASRTCLRRAASRLARNRRVRAVIVCGVQRRNRAWLRNVFAPLGDRLHLYGPTEMDGDALLGVLRSAR